jgi:AraC family transcriptional regulator
MDYRIEEKPAFNVVGKALRVATKDGENFRVIPQFWQQCLRDGSHDQLVGLAAKGEVLPNVTLGICMDFTDSMEAFTYMIAAQSPPGTIPDGMVERAIPAATWAVFESKGAMPQAIQDVWGKIWSEFFETAPFIHGAAPDIEVYPKGDATSADYVSEVWVPVIQK